MQKQHFTTKVARLVNPPLRSYLEQIQLNGSESIYASRKIPLGRTKPPDIPKDVENKCFGIVSKKGVSADVLIYPSGSRMFSSMYDYDFVLHKNSGEMATAGVISNGNGVALNSSEQIKALFQESLNLNYCGNGDKRKKETEYKTSFQNHLNENCKAKNEHRSKRSFQKFLKILLNMDETLYKKFFYFANYQLENCSKISITDFQDVILRFGFCISNSKLEKLLSDFDLSVRGEIDVKKLLDDLNWNSSVSAGSEDKRSGFLQSKRRIFGEDVLFHDSVTSYEDLKHEVSMKPAGLPPPKSDPCIIQPTVFERNGIFEGDLNEQRCKKEIISILHKSGMCFKKEMFDLVWEKLNVAGKASIGDVWKTMKHLYLSY